MVVVTTSSADYSLRMPEAAAALTFHVVDRDGPAGRLRLRRQLADRVQHVSISGYEGPELPEVLTSATVQADHGGVGAFRITSSQGNFDFRARAVDLVEACPAFYEPLHRKFALTISDRMALHALLLILRLPVGMRLLRLWHSRRR